MIKVPIEFTLDGYAYDPGSPTVEAEKLCFVLTQVMTALRDAGVELWQPETSDITSTEAYVEGLYDALNAQELEGAAIDFATPSVPEILTVAGLGAGVMAERSKILSLSQQKEAGISEGSPGAISESIDLLTEQVSVNNLREEVIYLSDGHKIYGKTGLAE
jgi:hypothetical protein